MRPSVIWLVGIALLPMLACHRGLKDRDELALWPAVAPGSEHVAVRETITERSRNPALHDRFVTGVTRPTLTAFVPENPNGASLIVAAGGGYVREVIDHEGYETAAWFAAHGVTAFYLKYRLPSDGLMSGRRTARGLADGHPPAPDIPLEDAQRAVRVVRAHAHEWQLDANRVGIIGFSAGGHVAASLADRFVDSFHSPIDATDALSARPDYVLLLYPVISMRDEIAHPGSRLALLGDSPSMAQIAAYSAEDHVSANNPPTLVVLSADDKSVSPQNGIGYYQALRKAGVRADLHVYMEGGHGFGIGQAKGACSGWTDLALEWMAALGVTRPRSSGALGR